MYFCRKQNRLYFVHFANLLFYTTMIKFPENLFSDVRIEEIVSTTIVFEAGDWKSNHTRRQTGAFIRVYDGQMWYYAATTDLNNLQQELDSLAAMATPNTDVLNDPVVKRHQANKDKLIRFADHCITDIPHKEKEELVRHNHDLLVGREGVAMVRSIYTDEYRKKHIVSSIGCDVEWDYQQCGLAVVLVLNVGTVPYSEYKPFFANRFDELNISDETLLNAYNTGYDYAKNAVPVVPGTYPVILAPKVTGVFAHESFGHKSESDFMLGDENMLREWALGTKVGSDILNIYDEGDELGSGYTPYDDEGNKKIRAWLIRDGILAGRLHSCATAAALNEDVTGNARALNFEYEPIVRMTSTCIGAGKQTKEELFASIKEGVFIADYNHGSGMSTFTIAPSKAFMIRDGKIAEPVRVSVITGNVMETLHLIDGLSDKHEVISSAFGGCGKMEQGPLRVSDGGPYMRVSAMNVQ